MTRRRDSVQMCSYELPLAASEPARPETVKKAASASLPDPLLARNVLWFCRLRWIIVAIFVAFGTTGLFPEALGNLGLRPQTVWPFVIAAILALGNLGFLMHGQLLKRPSAAAQAKANLWAQIALDLSVLTVVIHYVGSLETFAPFVYLFHIVLACIFFSRAQSFVVTAMGSVLYAICVAAERSGILPPASIYLETSLREHVAHTPAVPALSVLSAVLIFTVVWYLASHLSAMVRERDYKLAETNRRLERAQEEKTRHMLHTTHELKAPFAAIHANMQLLLKGYCGVLPEDALVVVRRISKRCRRLATEIQEMLQLANLHSADAELLDWVDVDLAHVLTWCVGQIQQTAREHGVIIENDMQHARVVGVEDHLKMLFSNLLTNAVTYSHEEGRVRVRCTYGRENGPVVIIQDRGIGIPGEKLPHIFDEYYRTDEAVRHNKESTGLGLAIVRQVAETHGIRVRVESLPGAGTKFELRFPRACETVQGERAKEE